MSPKIGFLGFSRGQKTGQAPTKLMFFAKNTKNVIFCVCQDRRPFLRNKSRKKHEKKGDFDRFLTFFEGFGLDFYVFFRIFTFSKGVIACFEGVILVFFVFFGDF
jgi:hypothetical protein